MSYKSINPFNNETGLEIPYCSQQQITETIQKLHDAYINHNKDPATKTQKTSEELTRLAKELDARREELAKAITIETGKAISESDGEVKKAIGHCNYFAENIDKYPTTELVDTDAKKSGYFLDPIGVIYKISPANFPVWISIRMIVPNLVVGNAVILRVPSQNPRVAQILNEVFEKAQLDRIRVIFASSGDTEFVLQSDLVHGVSFTGSTSSGSTIGALAGKYVKRCVLELGGNDPFVLLDDGDVDLGVKVAIASRLKNNGQVCSCSKRFIIHSSKVEEFTKKLAEAAAAKTSGDPLEKSTDLGTMNNERTTKKLVEQLGQIGDTAELVFGSTEPNGNYFGPMGYKVKKENYEDSILSKEELFGPVFSIYSFDDVEEAIKLANASQYGLGACIIGKDEDRAEQVTRRIDSGMVYINTATSSRSTLPNGGVKASGIGRDGGIKGLEAFANIKTFYIASN